MCTILNKFYLLSRAGAKKHYNIVLAVGSMKAIHFGYKNNSGARRPGKRRRATRKRCGRKQNTNTARRAFSSRAHIAAAADRKSRENFIQRGKNKAPSVCWWAWLLVCRVSGYAKENKLYTTRLVFFFAARVFSSTFSPFPCLPFN